VIASQRRQLNFSRTVWITFHCRGTTSSVSVMSSPSLASLPPQHGQVLGAAMTTRSRGRCAGNGARTGFLRLKLTTDVVLVGVMAASSSAALASNSSSCSSIWSSRCCPRSDDWPKRSRFILAISSFRCATIASAPEARASACWRVVRSAASAALSASISSGAGSGAVTNGIVARAATRARSPSQTAAVLSRQPVVASFAPGCASQCPQACRRAELR
jgi:hypothetical protein